MTVPFKSLDEASTFGVQHEKRSVDWTTSTSIRIRLSPPMNDESSRRFRLSVTRSMSCILKSGCVVTKALKSGSSKIFPRVLLNFLRPVAGIQTRHQNAHRAACRLRPRWSEQTTRRQQMRPLDYKKNRVIRLSGPEVLSSASLHCINLSL